MRLNLNDNIKVKLTEHGKDIYYHQYDMTNAFLGRELCKPSYPKVDEDGYTTFQLWCFMELYGVHMGMTLPNVIEPLDLMFDAPTIEPERKTGTWKGYNADESNWQRDDGTPIFLVCSECNGVVINNGSAHWNFCPNCGNKKIKEGEDK